MESVTKGGAASGPEMAKCSRHNKSREKNSKGNWTWVNLFAQSMHTMQLRGTIHSNFSASICAIITIFFSPSLFETIARSDVNPCSIHLHGLRSTCSAPEAGLGLEFEIFSYLFLSLDNFH